MQRNKSLQEQNQNLGFYKYVFVTLRLMVRINQTEKLSVDFYCPCYLFMRLSETTGRKVFPPLNNLELRRYKVQRKSVRIIVLMLRSAEKACFTITKA